MALVVVAVVFIVMCYVGWGQTQPNWNAALDYPNKGAGAATDPESFTPAQKCGECHVQHYEEWAASGMGRSSDVSRFLIDLYEASLDIRGAPPEDVAQCLHCHAPLAVMGEEPDLAMAKELSQDGINCDVCHTAVEAHANDAPGMIRWEPTGPKRGPLLGSEDPPQAGVLPAVSSFHRTKRSPLHSTSELCGACHMSLWPTNALPIDWTYPEWKRSPWAKEGATCQSCHMAAYEGASVVGSPTRTLHRHTFPGGGDEEFVRGTAELRVSAEAHFSGHELSVEVENTRAGHSFPTGNATAPVVKLIVKAFDGAGTEVFADHRDYRLLYVDQNGEVTSDPSTAIRLRSDTTLQPREPKHERFYVPTHLGAVRVEAVLEYQRWSEDITNNHAGLVSEFIGRYMEQGFRVHRLIARIPDLDYDKLQRIRSFEPIEVAAASLTLPPLPAVPSVDG